MDTPEKEITIDVMTEKFLTPAEVSQLIGASVGQVYIGIREESIPYVKLGGKYKIPLTLFQLHVNRTIVHAKPQ